MRVRLWPHTAQPGNLSFFFFDNVHKYEEFWSELSANDICYVKGDWTCIFLSWLLTMVMEILALKITSLKLTDAVVQEGGLTPRCDVYMGHSLFVPVALSCRVFNMVHSLGLPACRKVFTGCSRLLCGMHHLLNWFLGSHSEPFRPFALSICAPSLFKILCHSEVILEIEISKKMYQISLVIVHIIEN